MRALLGDLFAQKIPVRVYTSDGNEHCGLIVSLPAVNTASEYDYVGLEDGDSSDEGIDSTQYIYIARQHIVAVAPDRRPDVTEFDENGDPI
ncbi:hypothetical protein ACPCXD_07745 [Rhodococcus sp. AB351]|uniref:hypothetical protein n=1 Tax=Rhodococcus sp. AB351 TaxID=3413280 RepID=UPI003C295559